MSPVFALLVTLVLAAPGGERVDFGTTPGRRVRLLRHENPALPGNSSTVTIHGVKLDSWNYEMPEDDFVIEGATFKALWISAVDETA